MNNTKINSSNITNLFKSILNRLQLTGLVLGSVGVRGVSYKNTQQKYAGGFVTKILPSVGLSLPEVGTLTIGPEYGASIMLTNTEVKDVHITKELTKKLDSMMQYAKIKTSPSDAKDKIIEISKVEKTVSEFFPKEMDQYELTFDNPSGLNVFDFQHSPKLKKEWDSMIDDNKKAAAKGGETKISKGWILFLGDKDNVEQIVTKYNSDPKNIPTDLQNITNINDYSTKPGYYHYLNSKPASIDSGDWKDVSDINIGKATSGMEFQFFSIEKKEIPVSKDDQDRNNEARKTNKALQDLDAKIKTDKIHDDMFTAGSTNSVLMSTYSKEEYVQLEKSIKEVSDFISKAENSAGDKKQKVSDFLNGNREKLEKIHNMDRTSRPTIEHSLKSGTTLTHDKMRAEFHKSMKNIIKGDKGKITLDEYTVSISHSMKLSDLMGAIESASVSLPHKKESISTSEIAVGTTDMSVGTVDWPNIPAIYSLENVSVYRALGLLNVYHGFVVSLYVNQSLFDLVHGVGINVHINVSDYLSDTVKEYMSYHVATRKQERATDKIDYNTAKSIAGRMSSKEFANLYLEVAGRDKDLKPLEQSDWTNVSNIEEDLNPLNEVSYQSNKIGFVFFLNVLRDKALNITFVLPFLNGAKLADHYAVDVSIVTTLHGMPLGGYDYYSMDSAVVEVVEEFSESQEVFTL